MHYQVEKTTEEIAIHDVKSNYTLFFPFEQSPCFEVYFLAPKNGVYPKERLLITARDLEKYDSRILNIPLKKDFQYLEIGAGLGGLIEGLYNKIRKFEHPPIVIDPVNYEIMLDMLAYGKNYAKADRVFDRLNALEQRAELVLSDKVRLVNKTLGDALKFHPELVGIADVVVDNQGAMLYPETEQKRKSQSLVLLKEKIAVSEKRLLKPDGMIIN